jgi:EmrB/QacA subfamily drug resistance transporter
MYHFKFDRRWWVMINVGIGIYMSTLDASVVNISLPTITQALHTDLKMVAWVVTAYLTVITGCLLLMGGLADHFGQRKVYLLGFTIFTVGSLFCGLSPGIRFLIGSRMIQGLGAAALMVNGTAIVTRIFPEKVRGQALGIIGSIVSIGFLTGPLIGGFMVEQFGWRSIFFINVPIGLVGIFFALETLEKDRPSRKAQLDLWGALFLFVFITALLIFLNQRNGDSSQPPWPWLLVCLLSLSLFIVIERRFPFPLVDLRLFKRGFFVSSLVVAVLAFCMSGAHALVIPFFLQGILKFPPSKVGMLLFPVSVSVMVVAPLGGRISDRIGTRLPTMVGLILISLTTFSFCFIRQPVGDWEIIWRQVVIGVGIALFNPANNSAIIGSLPREQVGLASSFLPLARNFGMVVGVALAETVVSLKSTMVIVEAGTGIPTIEAIQGVWRVVAVIGVMAGLLAWTKGKPPEKR